MEKVISPITGKSKYLLIENCEVISDIKISQDLKESLKLSAGKAGTLIVKNLPGTILNRENQNGRIYSTAVLAQAIRDAKPLFETKQLLSQACEHPEGSFVSPTTASHVVTNAYIKKNVNVVVDGERGTYDMLFMDIEVLNTDEGKNLRALLEAECSVGTSIRGVGDMEGKYVKNYEFLGIDFVGNPSSSTFTRMPVSESVKVEVKDPKELKETFTVSTSSTNVVRDLDQAAMLQQQLDGLGYGTVTKTSTKLDQETDPKTGAQTSIATLEAETSDDVADLDQALQMARNAMLNGTINVDSITIENIPEEGETKEAVEAEYVPEKTTLKEKPVTEAKKEDDEEDPNLGKKFVLHTDRGFVTFDKNAIDFTDKPEDALHFTEGKEENGMVSMSKVTEILDAMGIFEVEKYFQRGNINLGAEDKPVEEGLIGKIVGGGIGGAVGTAVGMPVAGAGIGATIGSAVQDGKFTAEANTDEEAALNEENGANTKYIAKVNIVDANGSNQETIPVSATDLEGAKNEIGNLWEMKNKSVEGQGDVTVTLVDTQTGEETTYNPQSQLLEDSDQKNPEEIDDDPDTICAGCEEQFEKDSMYKIGEDEYLCSNCYQILTGDNPFKEEYNEADFEDPVICSWCKDMFEKTDCKKEKDMGWLCDQCIRGLESRGVELEFEDETDPKNVVEEDADVEVNDNKVITKLDDDTTIEKDFDSPIQAQVATAAVAQGKADPKVLVPEANVDEKLYSKPSEPSDSYDDGKEPLTDAATDLLVTLYDIDWDFDKIGKDLTPEDYKELVDVLPDPWTIRLNAVDLEGCDGIYDIRKVILAKANEQAPWKINSAFVQKVEDVNSGEVYYNSEPETDVKPERDWSDDEYLDDTLAMYHNAGIDG